jgi:hypothetical protein
MRSQANTAKVREGAPTLRRFVLHVAAIPFLRCFSSRGGSTVLVAGDLAAGSVPWARTIGRASC